MLASESWRDPVLINTIGHTSGVLLFGLIIALLVRDWRTHGVRRTELSLLAAVLALGWNVGSLIALSPLATSAVIETVTVLNFSLLSMLPAVLLQVALQGQQRLIVLTGYLVSLSAVALHCAEPFSDHPLHQAGLVAIVFGFGALTIAAFLFERRRGPSLSPAKSTGVSLAFLLLFTSTFLHFGYHHVNSPWAAEIAWHHIGIPVAVIVLLADYRFLLLDTFLRFLLNVGLAALCMAVLLLLNFKLHLWEAIRSSPFLTGLSLVGLCVWLICFAYLRNGLQTWMSRVLFRRSDVDHCVRAIMNLAISVHTEEELLSQAGARIGSHFGAEHFAIVKETLSPKSSAAPSVLFADSFRDELPRRNFHAEAQLPLRFSGGDSHLLLMGSRQGGRRYASEDLEDMRRLGAAVVEQVEHFRAEELKRLVNQAELRALQAQINPHFLFNALNTLYGTIDQRSREARRMVVNLAEIFRYFLRGHQTVIPLSEELRIVEAYLEIEAFRLGDRLKTEIVVHDSDRLTSIPILSIQPLVENAIKHGVASKAEGGRVSVRAEREPGGLRIVVEDTGVGFERSKSMPQDGMGLGLENVRRRLILCYGSSAELQIQSNGVSTIVSFVVPHAAEAAADLPIALLGHASIRPQ